MALAKHHIKRDWLFRTAAATALATAVLSSLGSAALAEDYKTPPREFLDPLGIDIVSTDLPRHDIFLTVGDPSAGGLSWSYGLHYYDVEGDFRGHLGDACTDPPPIFSDPSCDSSLQYSLMWIGDSAITFQPNGSGGWINWSGTGATLVTSGGNYLYTSDDGTVYTVNATSNLLTSIKHPNGMLVTLLYVSGVLDMAVSNTGFAFKFQHTTNDKRIYAINLLAHSGCEATPQSCASYDSQIKMSGGTDMTITDRANKPWIYRVKKKFNYTDPLSNEIVSGPKALWYFEDPTHYSVTLTRATRGGLLSFVDPRGTFEYTGQATYADPNDSYTGATCVPFAHAHVAGDCTTASPYLLYSAEMNYGSGNSSFNKDALGRQTNYGIVAYNHGFTGSGHPIAPYTRLTSVTKPGGDYVTYTYDARGNVTSAVQTGTGTSPPTRSFTASFPSTCTNLATCNQPTWTKDALGNETDYTYDSTHGGVLTMTLPLDQDNLRKKTFNTYSTFNTGNGNIYRLTRSETCGLTATQLSALTACPAAVTTSVTTTDYGTVSTAPYTYKSFQPYSVTQTDGASTLTATTTYGYDILGNVVMTDGPRTDVSDVSYKIYDLNRRVVCEISPDPDGTVTTLSRLMVRHVYDDAGRETETDTGTGTSTTACAPGVEMTRASYKLMTYDAAGRLVKTETKVTP